MSKTKWFTFNLVKPVPFEGIIIFLVIYFETSFVVVLLYYRSYDSLLKQDAWVS